MSLKSSPSTPLLLLGGMSHDRHRPKYYFLDENAIFLVFMFTFTLYDLLRHGHKVDGCLFNIHRHFLQTSENSLFRTMFSLPSSGRIGFSSLPPSALEQVSVQEFEALLRVLYPQYVLRLGLENVFVSFILPGCWIS